MTLLVSDGIRLCDNLKKRPLSLILASSVEPSNGAGFDKLCQLWQDTLSHRPNSQ